MKKTSLKACRLALIAVGLCAPVKAAEQPDITYQGAGWIQMGKIFNSSDSSGGADNDYDGNWMQMAGGQITALVDISENWQGGLGLGVLQTAGARGSINAARLWTPFWAPYISEARATYTARLRNGHSLAFTLGAFPFNYNKNVKNLGLYLLRGYVYPQVIISGFETTAVLPIANMYGLHIQHRAGRFRHDFILNSEKEYPPYFDLSAIYLFRYRFGFGLEIGGGINFFRLIPQNKDATSLKKDCPQANVTDYNLIPFGTDKEVCFIEDTIRADDGTGNPVLDSVEVSLAGEKVMGRLSWDIKKTLGLGAGKLGANDLIAYCELGVLGFDNYPKYYEKITDRMPLMLAFNLPAFQFLDVLSVELEWFKAPYHPDYGKAVKDGSAVPRKVQGYNTKIDDFKWSLYAAKIIKNHLKISAQLASDHLRTGGYAEGGNWSENLVQPSDMYIMFKLAYYY